MSGDGFTLGTVLYLPDFTNTGSHWEILAMSGGDHTVRVTITLIRLLNPTDAPNAMYLKAK